MKKEDLDILLDIDKDGNVKGLSTFAGIVSVFFVISLLLSISKCKMSHDIKNKL